MNNTDCWHKYLTDYKYLVPLSKFLLNDNTKTKTSFDINMLPIFNFFADKNTLSEIKETIPNGRLNWYANRLCFYPYGGGGSTIVFDWGDFKRNYYLLLLLNKGIINLKDKSILIGNIFIGWNINFFYNQKEYTWTGQNQLKFGEDIVLNNPTYDSLKKLFNITD